jgi:hypothetical protein
MAQIGLQGVWYWRKCGTSHTLSSMPFCSSTVYSRRLAANHCLDWTRWKTLAAADNLNLMPSYTYLPTFVMIPLHEFQQLHQFWIVNCVPYVHFET